MDLTFHPEHLSFYMWNFTLHIEQKPDAVNDACCIPNMPLLEWIKKEQENPSVEPIIAGAATAIRQNNNKLHMRYM